MSDQKVRAQIDELMPVGQDLEFDKVRDQFYSWDGAVLLTAEQVRKIILYGKFIPLYSDEDELSEAREIRDAEIACLEDWMQVVLNEGHMFDAGSLPNSAYPPEHVKRALHLFWDQHIVHPFQNYIVILRDIKHTNVICVQINPEHPWDMVLFCLQADKPPPFAVAEGATTMLSLCAAGLVRRSSDDNDNMDITPYMRILPDDTEEVREHCMNWIGYAYAVIAVFLAMINTKYVETQRVEAPHKLNKRRKAQGKPMLPGFLRVLSKDYVTAISARGTGQGSASFGGSHASPVGHKRRAHVRALPKGDVLVREALVNINKGKIGPSVRSHYQVKT